MASIVDSIRNATTCVPTHSSIERLPNSELIERVRFEQVVYRCPNELDERLEIPDENASVDWATDKLVDEVVDDLRTRLQYRYYRSLGHVGLLAYDGNSWIACGWICRPNSSKFPSHLPDWLEELDVYWLFAAITRERYRRKGWHKYLLAQRIRAIYDHDPEATIYVDTRVDNVSRHSMESIGFVPAGVITAYRLLPEPIDVKTIGWWDRDRPHPPLAETDCPG